MKKSLVATAVSSIVGISGALPGTAMSASLGDGYYDMIIHSTNSGYTFLPEGAWDSGFYFHCVPGAASCYSTPMNDDTIASPANGRYDGNVGDGIQGKAAIKIEGGVITGGLGGLFEFDMMSGTAGGNFVEYGDSTQFTGSIDVNGNITLTTTGLLGTFSDFPSLVDEAWNLDNFDGAGNPPNGNTVYDSFTTGTASNNLGAIQGAAYDGYSAILVKAGHFGDAWGGFFGAAYFEVWNVSFVCIGYEDMVGACGPLPPPPSVPVPAAVWLFGSGLLGVIGVARKKKKA